MGDEETVKQNGIQFKLTHGAPPSAEPMLQQLEEVKDLFEEKFGHSVDDETVKQDGIQFKVTRGAPPSAESMLHQLEEVKDLFEEKFGHGVDEEIMNGACPASGFDFRVLAGIGGVITVLFRSQV